MVTTGGAGGLAPSEVLAAEKVGVPMMAKPGMPTAARVSPFFARPALTGMLMKARFAAMRTLVAPFSNRPVLDATLLKAPLASLRSVEDTIPSGYYPVENAAQVYYAGSNTWYVDTYYLWDLLDYNRDEYWPMYSVVEWLWAIVDQYDEPVAGCWYVEDHCAWSGYLYSNGPGWLHSNEEYECVGNERWRMWAVIHYYEDDQWKWKFLVEEDIFDLGCD